MPGQLRRQSLNSELQQRREDNTDKAGYFGSRPVLQVFVDGACDPIAPLNIWFCSLDTFPKAEQISSDGCHFIDGDNFQVAVDPKLGRLAFPPKALPDWVTVDYAYGFSGDVGGGPYNRIAAESTVLENTRKRLYWDVVQCGDTQPLKAALQAWNLTAQRWQCCYEQHFIPLARIRIDLKDSGVKLLDPKAKSAGQPAQRINVRINPCFNQAL